MPRTTLDIDPSVLTQLRRRGRDQGKSMGQVASEILAAGLEKPHEPAPFRWKTHNLGKPKVDLEDKEALRRALEE